jgi:hypothetical protein
MTIEKHSIVTWKDVATYFNMKEGWSKQALKKTRDFYKQGHAGAVTLEQVIKANNLEK